MKLIELDPFRSVEENHDTLLTALLTQEKEESLSQLRDMIQKCQSISHPKRRKLVNDRLYQLITFLESKHPSVMTRPLACLFLVGKNLQVFTLGKKQKQTIQQYGIRSFHVTFDTIFPIDYLVDLFQDFQFIQVFHMDQHLN